MIGRRLAMVVLAAGTAVGTSARAQPSPARLPRVVVLSPGVNDARPVYAAFRAGLTALGWVEGRNFELQFLFAKGSNSLLADLSRGLLQSGAEVVLADGRIATAAMFAANSPIPVVMVSGDDPVALGYAKNYARPGGKVTGVHTLSRELSFKLVEFMLEIVPHGRRFAVVGTNLTGQTLNSYREAEMRTGLGFTILEIHSAQDVEIKLSTSALAEFEGILFQASPVTAAFRDEIVRKIAASRKPAIYSEREYVEAGGLISYGVKFDEAFRRAAGYVDRILKGSSPAEMPIERLERVELIINRRTAQAMGIALPGLLLGLADELIE